ncbi:MAG: nucleotidyltransferase [Ruminococcaceae bacterium]|nr:nucleotidyltransferase [Oscillospiraceae bacterium]
MNNKNPELVVLAAGMGSRYGGLKQIDSVDDYGHIIIDFSIYDAIRAGFRDITFIIKKEIEKDFREVMDPHLIGKGINVKYVYQELDKLPEGFTLPEGRRKPWGTGHAIACCLGVVKAPFAVINADDYYGRNAFSEMYEFLKNAEDTDKYHYAMVAYKIKNTVTEEGTVSRGVCEADESSYLKTITERTKVGVENGKIYYSENDEKHELLPETPVSMNLFGFTESYIKECAERFPLFLEKNLESNPEKCEFYMPSVVGELLSQGKADVKMIEGVDKWYGVTYKEDKAEVVRAFKKFFEDGIYPKNF